MLEINLLLSQADDQRSHPNLVDFLLESWRFWAIDSLLRTCGSNFVMNPSQPCPLCVGKSGRESQFIVLKSVQHNSEMIDMIILTLRVHQDVVNVDYNKQVQKLPKHPIHKINESSQSISPNDITKNS